MTANVSVGNRGDDASILKTIVNSLSPEKIMRLNGCFQIEAFAGKGKVAILKKDFEHQLTGELPAEIFKAGTPMLITGHIRRKNRNLSKDNFETCAMEVQTLNDADKKTTWVPCFILMPIKSGELVMSGTDDASDKKYVATPIQVTPQIARKKAKKNTTVRRIASTHTHKARGAQQTMRC